MFIAGSTKTNLKLKKRAVTSSSSSLVAKTEQVIASVKYYSRPFSASRDPAAAKKCPCRDRVGDKVRISPDFS
jgi:hypothetical protein